MTHQEAVRFLLDEMFYPGGPSADRMHRNIAKLDEDDQNQITLYMLATVIIFFTMIGCVIWIVWKALLWSLGL